MLSNFLLEKENQEKEHYKEYFRTNFDRPLTKAIVMPLIYGKTIMLFVTFQVWMFHFKSYIGAPTTSRIIDAVLCKIETISQATRTWESHPPHQRAA